MFEGLVSASGRARGCAGDQGERDDPAWRQRRLRRGNLGQDAEFGRHRQRRHGRDRLGQALISKEDEQAERAMGTEAMLGAARFGSAVSGMADDRLATRRRKEGGPDAVPDGTQDIDEKRQGHDPRQASATRFPLSSAQLWPGPLMHPRLRQAGLQGHHALPQP